MSKKSNKKNISAKETKEDYIKEIQKIFDKQEDLKSKEKVSTVDEVKKKWDMNDKIVQLFVDNIGQDQKWRSRYAIILLVILALELIALTTIFILKGVNILNYSDTTFNIFISGGIAEVFILVKVIVEYLFKDNLTEALKIIITMNNNSDDKVNKEASNIKNKKN